MAKNSVCSNCSFCNLRETSYLMGIVLIISGDYVRGKVTFHFTFVNFVKFTHESS